jgi:EmrB/QacA subfamily drug resistance transporter
MNNPHSRWLVLCVILTAPLLYVIDIFIINMAIPVIKQRLGATHSDVQLVIAGYLTGSACALIPAARAGDFLGRKKVFFQGMLFFTLTSCLCGISQSPWQLNLARFFQGISSAFMVTQSLSLIQELFPLPGERAKAIGWYGMTLSIAAIIGQTLGGYLAEADFIVAGWRLIFFINVPVGLASMWAISKYITETSKRESGKFDFVGTTMFTYAVGLLVYALTVGREAGWPSWSILMATTGTLTLVVFYRHQKRQPDRHKMPLMNVGIFREPGFLTGLAAVLFHFMLHTAYLLMIAVFLQSGMGISALHCGLYFLPHALLFMISSYFGSKMLIRFGKNVLLCGLAIILISFILHVIFLNEGTRSLTIIGLIGLYGLGNGAVLPFLLNVVLDDVKPDDASMASGIFSTFQQVASALGIAIIGGFFYGSLHGETAADYKNALDSGLLTGSFFSFLVALMLLVGKKPGNNLVLNGRPETP